TVVERGRVAVGVAGVVLVAVDADEEHRGRALAAGCLVVGGLGDLLELGGQRGVAQRPRGGEALGLVGPGDEAVTGAAGAVVDDVGALGVLGGGELAGARRVVPGCVGHADVVADDRAVGAGGLDALLVAE